jgi:hypothetical protein
VRISRFGWVLLALAVAAVAVTPFAPKVGIGLAMLLAVILLAGLAEGLGGGSDSHGGHEAWARTDAERRREVRHGPGQGPGPGGV